MKLKNFLIALLVLLLVIVVTYLITSNNLKIDNQVALQEEKEQSQLLEQKKKEVVYETENETELQNLQTVSRINQALSSLETNLYKEIGVIELPPDITAGWFGDTYFCLVIEYEIRYGFRHDKVKIVHENDNNYTMLVKSDFLQIISVEPLNVYAYQDKKGIFCPDPRGLDTIPLVNVAMNQLRNREIISDIQNGATDAFRIMVSTLEKLFKVNITLDYQDANAF